MEEDKKTLLTDDEIAKVSGGRPIQPDKRPNPYKKTFGDSDEEKPA
jgi:hypothetical protein